MNKLSKEYRDKEISIQLYSSGLDLDPRVGLDVNQISDFLVKSINLNEAQSNVLLNGISENSNYEKVNRKCKFLPRYGISLDGEPVAFFDPEFCPAILFISSNSLNYDFREFTVDNTMLSFIQALNLNEK